MAFRIRDVFRILRERAPATSPASPARGWGSGWRKRRESPIFHFLQAFWFRLVVDVRIEELLKEEGR
jgi:hypothetical protein